jgi:CSLREA domain-containing protein
MREWLLSARIVLAVLPAVGLPALSSELIGETPAPSGFGILYSVNTTSDTVVVGACQNGLAGCSLRGAIQAANAQPNGVDGISLDLPAGSVINLTQALPDITDDVAIFGAGADQVTVRRNAAPNYRIFNVTTSSAVSFTGLTISNGAMDNGGGINHGSGTLNLTNCVFLSNVAQNGGGVNNNSGTLNVTNCTFTGNGAGSNGGGIANNFFGTVNVINSTFSGNSATTGDPNADGGGGHLQR